MDETVTEKLGRLTELSPGELTELESALLDEFDSIDEQVGDGEVPAELGDVVTNMKALADAIVAVRSEVERRNTEGELDSEPLDPNVPAPVAADAEVDTAAAEAAASAIRDVRERVAATRTPVASEAPAELAVAADAGTAVAEAPPEIPPVVEPEPAPAEPEALAPVAAETQPPAAADNEPAQEPVPVPEASATPEPAPEVPAASATEPPPAEPAVPAPVAEADSVATTPTPEDPVSVENEAEATPPAGREAIVTSPRVAITAGADIPGVNIGQELPNMKAIAEAFTKRQHGMRRTTSGDGEQHTVATLTASYDEDRVLRGPETQANLAKIEAVTSPKAVVAAGGLCAPLAVSYDVFGLGAMGRPVRDSLPSFNADRGGIHYVTPPVLSDLAGAVALWTVQDDIDAGTEGGPEPTKPCIRVACGVDTSVMLDAITLCLTFGNLTSRTYPELVERHNELGLIQHARFAETRLLTRIGTLSTAVTADRVLGAARDWFRQVEVASAAYRSRHRMAEDAQLQVIAPVWMRNLFRADLTQQLPGDGPESTWALADSMINSWLADRNVSVTWHIDGETGQIMPAQTAGALNSFPNNVIWYIFAPGTFLFLDGGTLDLGLVRDSTLNATNDYKMFLETFEAVAKVGIESLKVTSRLEPVGTSSGTKDLSAVDL